VTCKIGLAVGLAFFQLRVHSVIPCSGLGAVGASASHTLWFVENLDKISKKVVNEISSFFNSTDELIFLFSECIKKCLLYHRNHINYM